MSVSRLHHGCPRREAHPKVVQGATASHHQSADALLPEAEPVLDDAAMLDMAVDMCDPQPTLVERLVRLLLLPRG